MFYSDKANLTAFKQLSLASCHCNTYSEASSFKHYQHIRIRIRTHGMA